MAVGVSRVEVSRDEAVLIAMNLLRESNPSRAALSMIEKIESDVAWRKEHPVKHRRRVRRARRQARA